MYIHPYCWVSEFSLSETFGAAGWPDNIAAPTSLIYICISMGAFTRQYIGSYWGRQANLSSRFSTNCIHASACVLKGRGGFGPVVNIFRSFCAVHILTVNILDYFSQCQNILFWFKIFFLWLCCAQQFNVNVDNIVYVDWLIGCVFLGTQVSTYCALPRCCLCWLIDYMWLAGRYTAMLFMLINPNPRGQGP